MFIGPGKLALAPGDEQINRTQHCPLKQWCRHMFTNMLSGSTSGEECQTRPLELLGDRWVQLFDRLELAKEEG